MVYPWKVPPPVANQIELFMHFLGASRDGLVARRVDLDTISSSVFSDSHTTSLVVELIKW